MSILIVSLIGLACLAAIIWAAMVFSDAAEEKPEESHLCDGDCDPWYDSLGTDAVPPESWEEDWEDEQLVSFDIVTYADDEDCPDTEVPTLPGT